MISTYTRARLLLLIGTIVCGTLFWWIGEIFDVPQGLSASFCLHSWASLIVVAVAFLAATLVGSVFAGSVRFDGGLFCACTALSIFSLRGGSMRYVLLESSSRNIFLILAIEVALLGVLVWCGWQLQRGLFRAGWLKEDSLLDGVIVAEDEKDQKLIALAAQIVVMTVLMLLLGQTDQKRQVLAAVGISAMLGSIAAYYAAPTQPSVWYWLGPFVVGAFGYVTNYLTPTGWAIGDLRGPLANLARPLPIDYASVGTAGAILGYWMSRRWQRNREDAEAEASTDPASGATT